MTDNNNVQGDGEIAGEIEVVDATTAENVDETAATVLGIDKGVAGGDITHVLNRVAGTEDEDDKGDDEGGEPPLHIVVRKELPKDQVLEYMAILLDNKDEEGYILLSQSCYAGFKEMTVVLLLVFRLVE